MSEPWIDPGMAAALRAFGLAASAPPALVEHSILNQNYRVETADGPVFLRQHRSTRTLERLERELAGAAWAAGKGIPTPEPLSSRTGENIVQIGGRFWSAYRWINGSSYRRGEIEPVQAGRLGEVHGRCIAALADYPRAADLPPNSELTWSTEQTLSDLRQVGPLVVAWGTDQERRWHARQLEMVQSAGPRPSTDFAWLPLQPAHGDFHERNVVFDDSGSLAAVVDWERFCAQPPAFELLRAVSFMLMLEEGPLVAYLRGFGRHAPLDPATVAPCVDAWWQSSLHNTWVFRDSFISGNERARQFLPEEEWRSVRFHDAAFRTWLTSMIVAHAC